jgi:hypothetical protein
VNSVISRAKQLRIFFNRSPYSLTATLRAYLCKTLIFPIIALYDIVYGMACTRSLRLLDTAYNDLMRSVLGLRRSQHFRISDMHKLTSFEPLNTRRTKALFKFMSDVIAARTFSKINRLLINSNHSHDTRMSNQYLIPVSRTSLGDQRVSVRGLKLLNLRLC